MWSMAARIYGPAACIRDASCGVVVPRRIQQLWPDSIRQHSRSADVALPAESSTSFSQLPLLRRRWECLEHLMLRGWLLCILGRHLLLPRRLPRVSRSGVLASYWLHWCCSLGCEPPGRACSGVELVARAPVEGVRGHRLPLVSLPCLPTC